MLVVPLPDAAGALGAFSEPLLAGLEDSPLLDPFEPDSAGLLAPLPVDGAPFLPDEFL